MNLSSIYKQVLSESKLDGTQINKSVFEYNGRTYRLTGYIRRYKTSDGEDIFADVLDPADANAVSGAGVGGAIADIDKIKILDRTTTWDDDFVAERYEAYKRGVEAKENQMKLKRIYYLEKLSPDKPLSMSQIRAIQDRQFDAEFMPPDDNAMQRFKNRTIARYGK